MANKQQRSSPYKFKTLGETCLLAGIIDVTDAQQAYTWIPSSKVSAVKRKSHLEKALNQGANGQNLRADQSAKVTSLSASIAKNEILRLIEVRIQEKGVVIVAICF